MAVKRQAFSMHWISSILLVSFAGVLYRFRSQQHKLTNFTLQDIYSRFWYKPEWLVVLTNQNPSQKTYTFAKQKSDKKTEAQMFLAYQDYKRYRQFANKYMKWTR